MKRAKCILILSVLVVNLTAWASPALLKEPLSVLLGHPHPALARIDAVQIVVVPSGDRRISDAAFWNELAVKVEKKLKLATIKIPDPNQGGQAGKPFDTPQFTVNVDVRDYNGEQILFSVRTTLARPVYVAVRDPGSQQLKPGRMVTASVWMEASAIMPATAQDLREVITRQTLLQADAFIAAWVASNRSERKESGSEAAVIEKIPTEKPTDSAPVEYKYVASKNSKVFHSPDCRSARRISPKNLTDYKTRDEAVRAGKRPCKLCTP